MKTDDETHGRQTLARQKARSSFRNEEKKVVLEACGREGNLDTLGECAREHTVDTAKLGFVNTRS